MGIQSAGHNRDVVYVFALIGESFYTCVWLVIALLSFAHSLSVPLKLFVIYLTI